MLRGNDSRGTRQQLARRALSLFAGILLWSSFHLCCTKVAEEPKSGVHSITIANSFQGGCVCAHSTPL